MENIDYLIHLVKFRINNTKTHKALDGSIVDADIFNDSDIVNALTLSISAFNCIPPFTNITFDDAVVRQIADILVAYAAYILLSRQSLFERGHEFSISDSGVQFTPPSLGDFIFNISERIFEKWHMQVKDFKKEKYSNKV